MNKYFNFGKYLKPLNIAFSVFLMIFFVLFSNYAIKNIAPYAIIKPYHAKNKVLTDYLHSRYKRLEVTTNDSIKLAGYLIKSNKQNPNGTIIILHGIGNFKESQIGIAEFLADNGFNAVLFDLRAHGESGGNYCTYGYYEKLDVGKFIDKIKEELPDSIPIGIIGTSLGGAIAIQALVVDKRIKCGVIVSTFSSLNKITYDYMKRTIFIPFKFVSDMALDEASRIANFPGNKINPAEYAHKVNQPVLIIHGTADKNIDIKYGKEIFQNIKSNNKSFYEVKDADHNNVEQVGGIRYRTQIINFLNKYLIME